MNREGLSQDIETLADSAVNKYPIVAGILYVVAGLTITREEALLAGSARDLSDYLLERNNKLLKTESDES